VLFSSSSFVAYRQQQHQQVLDQADGRSFSSVVTVEVNTTELCNRTCVFCPRVDSSVYPNQNLNISLGTVEVIGRELARLKFKGVVSFSGFGECLLHPQFSQILAQFRQYLPHTVLETNTNGDRLTADLLARLVDSGLTYLYWNLYDGPEQLASAETLVQASGVDSSRVTFRAQWPGATDNKTKNSRGGALATARILPLKQPCYYPFYKLFVDWNGDVLCCSNDWLRKRIMGNVHSEPLDAIWDKPEYHQFRKRLLHSDRTQEPCRGCDVEGTIFGQKSADIIQAKW